MTRHETELFKIEVYNRLYNYLVAQCEYYEKQNDNDDKARANIVRDMMKKLDKVFEC